MTYTLIPGTFQVVGFQPDGDSVRFTPDDPALINNLPGARKSLERGKSIQLRLECIDALETHYTSGSQRLTNQPMKAAKAAREALLELLGFTGVIWDEAEKVVVGCDADSRPGYILSKTFDSHGTRPVAYAFAKENGWNTNEFVEGAEVFMTAAWLTFSANFAMVEKGYAYPMYYEGAFHDIREKFNDAATTARKSKDPNNVWFSDATLSGFSLPPDATVTVERALWPKLFRRLSSFLKDEPHSPMDQFPAWLAANRDNCIDLDTGSWTALHNFVGWDGTKIKMTKSFQRLMFEG